ncbi:surface glycoprotein [Halorubrum sp. LN27]|uniref:surface glycoprotein n=1 Tax=Halorubrum sp. LN27 TaxID=2801032 RepID=UPI00190D30A4|nr:surface glycoprotein [Halorubrum sp. LN27]
MTRSQVRAVTLAAIMVLSVVAMGAGFVGGAAAQEDVIVVTDNPGDGEYASIPAALDAAAPGDTIQVQADQVITSPDNRIIVDTNASGTALDDVSIVADGDVTVRYEQPDEEAPGVNPGYPTFDVQADDVTISGFTVELDTNDVYDGDNRYAQAIKVGGFQASGGSGVELTDNDISFVGGDNDDITSVGIGLIDPNDGGQLDGATVTGNSIEGFEHGLFAATTDDGFSGNFDITNNDFQNNTVQYLDNSNEVDGESVFTENTFDNAAFSTDAQSTNDIIYASVQATVDDSQSEATVTVAPGTYAENVTVGVGGLSIEGPNAGIAGDADDRDEEATINGQVVVSADGVVFDGFEVSPPNATTNNNAEALRVSGTADDVVIRNNVVRDFSEDGIPEWIGVDGINLFGGEADDSVSNVTVSENLVDGVSGRSTAGGVAGISVQGNVEGAEINNNTVRNIGQRETTWAFGVTVRGTGNHGETPTEVSVVDNDVSSVLSNPESDTSGVGLGLESGDASDVTFEENSLSDTELLFEDKTATVDLTGFVDSNTLDRGTPVEGANVDGDTRNIVFNSVQDAQNAASTDSVLTLLPGTYNESVAIDTEGLTIEGPNADHDGISSSRTDEAVIAGQIDVGAPNTTVSGVQVSPNTETFEETPAAAVTVSESNTTVQNTRVADFEVNITDISANSVQGIQVYEANTELTDVAIRNNSVEDITYLGSSQALDGEFGTDYGNLYGIHVQGQIGDAIVEGNTLRDLSSDGYLLAAAVSGTDSNSDANPENVVVQRNTFESLSADGAPATGFTVSSDRVDADSLSVSRNSFLAPVDIVNGASENLDATFNYFGDDTPTVAGNVTYDPFLTVEPDEVDADSLSETTQFGHDLVVPADGDTHTVAFPSPVDGTVDEVFGEFNGTVYAYDGSQWRSGDDVADEEIGALDAFAVSVDEGEDDLRIAFEYAGADADTPPSMTTAELEAGWNFVGAPSGDAPSEDAFASATADVTSVVDLVTGPNAETTPYGLDASGDVSNPDVVSPFKGYWVFATADGELGATVPVGPTQEDEEDTLTGN